MLIRIFAVATLCGVINLSGAYAQDSAEPWAPPLQDEKPGDDGADLIGRGLGMLMENLLRDVGPQLDQLGQQLPEAMNNLAPIVKELTQLIDDLENYDVPERLDNGDIIMRRKTDAPPLPPFDKVPETEPPFFNPDAPKFSL